MKRATTIVAAIFMPMIGAAQSLSPDDIRSMVDQRISNLNPYQELLNDPDPARSLAAMQIMMESDDPELVRMAMEYGILSPNPTVKRTAFESFLETGPVFSIRFDGTDAKDEDFPGQIRRYWSGTAMPDKTGYWRIAVGEYLSDRQCYANTYNTNDCFLTVNSDGVFFTPQRMNGRAIIGDDGRLVGIANIENVGDPVPFTVQLID